MNKTKKVLSFIFAILFAFSFLAFVPEVSNKAEAAASFYSVKAYASGNKFIGEKVGSKYIWVSENGKKLYTASKWGGSKKLIKYVGSGNTYRIGMQFLTDGNKVIFAVHNNNNHSALIFKTDINGSYVQKVAVIKPKYDCMLGELVAYYGGKLYYNTYFVPTAPACAEQGYFCKYSFSSKQTAKVSYQMHATSGYGKYVAGGWFSPMENSSIYLLNLSNGKKTYIGEGAWPIVTSNRVLYEKYSFSYNTITTSVIRSTFSGQTKAKLMSTTNNSYSLSYLGRNYSLLGLFSYGNMKYKKYTYSTKTYSNY